ncbi:photosystem II stability/assembly factor-like uncharacterized protein [Paraburkholderia sp. UCT70]
MVPEAQTGARARTLQSLNMGDAVMIKMLVACAALCAIAAVWALPPGTVAQWAAMPARAWAGPSHMMLLDAARAGKRIVAVGEHGVIVLSDDEGKTWRQARQAPVSATLSAVTFIDAQRGWAVGQWGVILATTDGGETWERQRMNRSVDQPLFSVLFTNERDGLAVGLWSLMLATHDGGKTWAKVTAPKPPGSTRADRNLYHIFADRQGALYIDSEQGMVLKSTDGGANWSYLATGGKGTLWSGVALPDGRIVVGGAAGQPVPEQRRRSDVGRAQLGYEEFDHRSRGDSKRTDGRRARWPRVPATRGQHVVRGSAARRSRDAHRCSDR